MADVHEVIEDYRGRRQRLRGQISKLREEDRELEIVLRHLEREAAARAPKKPQPPELYDFDEKPDVIPLGVGAATAAQSAHERGRPNRGVPLSERKTALIEFLRKKGPASRAVILSEMRLPAGSLSALLAKGREEGWLARTNKGEWEVNDVA